jgi:hypothetical protein
MSLKLQKITESKWMDVVGVATVLTASIALGFHKTVVAGLPIGILSTVGAAVSMMGTRWATKRKNWGNAVGVVTSVNSAIVDYFLGNKAAFLTYPVSLIGNALSFLAWRRRENRIPRSLDRYYFWVAAGAFALAFGLNLVDQVGANCADCLGVTLNLLRSESAIHQRPTSLMFWIVHGDHHREWFTMRSRCP